MATKIGYVGRDASEQINWAEVGANFSGILKEEARVREEKKAEIDRSTREMMRTLDDAVTGDSENMNTWSLNYAQEAQQQLLMSNALLKNGQLKPKDYTVIRQNLSDGTDQAMTLAQEYQNEYADKMARSKANPGTTIGSDGKPITGSQELETFLMETAEGFGNFNKSKLVIDNKSGRVLVGFVNPETGEIEKDPNKLVGINNLRNRIKGKFDAYDMASSVTKAKAEVFGKFQTIDRKIGGARAQGLLTTYSDPTLRTQSSIDKMVKDKILTQAEADLYSTFEKTEEYWLETQLSQYNTTSLLTNNLRQAGGQKFNFTFNPSEQNESTILLKQVDGSVVPDFDNEIGNKQRDIAKEGLRAVLRGAMDHEVESRSVDDYTAPSYAPEYVYRRGDEKREKSSAVGAWGKLYSGNEAEQIAAANQLLGTQNAQDQGIYDIDLKSKPGSVILKFNGKGSIPRSSRTINMLTSDGKPIPYRDFVTSGNQIHGIDDVNEAVRASGNDKNAKYFEEKTGRATRDEGQPAQSARDRIIREVNTPGYKSTFQYGSFKNRKFSDVRQNLQSQANKFGGSIEPVEGSRTEFLVKSASGTEAVFNVDNTDNEDAKLTRDNFLEFLSNNLSEDSAKANINSFKFSKGGGNSPKVDYSTK